MEMHLDASLVNSLDFEKAYDRLIHFKETTFLIPFQFKDIYNSKKLKLINTLKSEIQQGHCNIQVPLFMSVPKKNHPYNRPGAILYPREALLYQTLVDRLIPSLVNQIDNDSVFSYRIDNVEGVEDLLKLDSGFDLLQEKIRSAVENGYSYALQTDLVSYYSNVNLHELQNNLLADIQGKEKEIEALDSLLKSFSSSSSRGLIQGHLASDLLANYYLTFVDTYARDNRVLSLRYVDDLYFFFREKSTADDFLYDLENLLQSKGLFLNESKTRIIPSHELIKEVTYVDELFENAKNEITDLFGDMEPIVNHYGELLDWEWNEGPLDPETTDVVLEAVKLLFEFKTEDKIQKNNIDKFCINKLKLVSDISAYKYVLENYGDDNPNSKIFSNYLWMVLNTSVDTHSEILSVYETKYPKLRMFSKLWLLTSLIEYSEEGLVISNSFIRNVMADFNNRNIPDILRAISAIFCLRYGNGADKTSIRQNYEGNSEYIKSAIYSGIKHFLSGDQQRIMLRDWKNDNFYNSLISEG